MSCKYLATHPNRGFLSGDRVMHCGENLNQRGRTGQVVAQDVAGKIRVRWDDSLCASNYSMDFALAYFAVSTEQLGINRGAFNGKPYVAKYSAWAIRKHQTLLPDFAFASHFQLKRMHAGLHTIQKIKENILQKDKNSRYKFLAVDCEDMDMCAPVAAGNTLKEVREALEANAEETGLTGDYIIMEAIQKVSIKPVRNFAVSCKDL